MKLQNFPVDLLLLAIRPLARWIIGGPWGGVGEQWNQGRGWEAGGCTCHTGSCACMNGGAGDGYVRELAEWVVRIRRLAAAARAGWPAGVALAAGAGRPGWSSGAAWGIPLSYPGDFGYHRIRGPPGRTTSKTRAYSILETCAAGPPLWLDNLGRPGAPFRTAPVS